MPRSLRNRVKTEADLIRSIHMLLSFSYFVSYSQWARHPVLKIRKVDHTLPFFPWVWGDVLYGPENDQL